MQKQQNLTSEERAIQLEEAFARATVALIRARQLYMCFWPLGMTGIMGVATVMGSLMYGSRRCWPKNVAAYFHECNLHDTAEEAVFVRSLQEAAENTNLECPLLALAEVVTDPL